MRKKIFSHLWFWLIIPHLVGFFPVAAKAQKPTQPIRYRSINQDFPSNVIYTITMDREGFIWICTDNGVAKYNGSYLKIIGKKEGLPSNDIFDIYVDKKNRKWVMGFFSGLFFIENDQTHAVSGAENLNRVIFAFERKGILYFSDLTNLYQFDEESGRLLFFEKLVLGDSLAIRGASDYFPKEVLVSSQKESTETYQLYSLSSKELIDIPDSLFVILSVNNLPILLPKRPFQNPESLVCLSKHYDEKIMLSDGNRILVFDRETRRLESLGDIDEKIHTAERATVDDEENIWFIDAITKEVYSLINFVKYVSEVPILPDLTSERFLFCEFRNNQALLLTRAKKLLLADLNLNTTILLKEFSSEGNLWGLVFEEDSIEVFGSRKKFLAPVSPNQNLVFQEFFNRYRYKTVTDELSLGLINESIYKNDTLLLTLPSELRFKSAYKHKNTTYFANEEVVFSFDEKGRNLRNTTQIKFSSKIQGIDSLVMISTSGSDLYILNDSLAIQEHIHLADELIRVATYDSQSQWLLIATDQHLYAYRWENLKLTLLNRLDLSLIQVLGKPIQIQFFDNKFYLATENGLYLLDKKVFERKIQGKISIDEVWVNGKKIHYKNLGKLDRESNNLTVKTSIHSFNSTRGDYSTYFSLSKSEEENWQKYEENEIGFKNLAPGRYQFKVASHSFREELSPENVVDFQFTILPYFYETTWFYSLLGLGILSMSVGVGLFLRKRQIQKIKLQLTMMNLETKALRAQMNPHFIFNIINNLQSSIILKDEQKTNSYFAKFSKLLRSSIEIVNQDNLSLISEINYLKSYLELEKIRTNQNFEVDYQIDYSLNLSAIPIPVMLLQPLVENAIIHGLMPKKGKKHIRFCVQKSKTQTEYLEIQIEDNGVGISNSKKSTNQEHTSVGLNNVRERLRIFNQINGSNCQLSLDDLGMLGLGSGTRATLTFLIP